MGLPSDPGISCLRPTVNGRIEGAVDPIGEPSGRDEVGEAVATGVPMTPDLMPVDVHVGQLPLAERVQERGGIAGSPGSRSSPD